MQHEHTISTEFVKSAMPIDVCAIIESDWKIYLKKYIFREKANTS